MSNFDITGIFPHANIRKEQELSIDFVLDAFLTKKKKFVILELGTGCGKSAIGITVARFLNQNYIEHPNFKKGANILTTQKVLQEQYINDFSPPKGNLVSIKSSTNFTCDFFKANSCNESIRMLKNEQHGSPFWKKCMHDCCYKKQKQLFLDSSEGITNFSYFLAETMHGGKIEPKQLLILDEAHNCEGELSKFIEVTISEKFAKDMLKLQLPTPLTEKSVIKWLNDVYLPALVVHAANAEAMLKKINMKEKIKEFQIVAAQIEMISTHLEKIKSFLQMWNDDNWIMNIVPPADRTLRKLEFKPVNVGPYADDLLFRFGKNVLLMSATIVNKDVFCESLGINKDDVEFLSMDSPFPIENRPIYYAPVGNMSQASLDESLPKLVEMIKVILNEYKGQKGIIHTHTFKIANYIKQNIKSKRLLIHDSFNRDEMIEKHKTSDKDTVILSPSLAEGIDLKDNLSRFQIICKMPYPYLGDKLVKKRMHRQPLWYPYQTAKTIVQSVGRSIRNETDHADTYVLDGNWEKFFRDNQQMFPNSFKKAIKKLK